MGEADIFMFRVFQEMNDQTNAGEVGQFVPQRSGLFLNDVALFLLEVHEHAFAAFSILDLIDQPFVQLFDLVEA
ncbi:hypothetical protein, partial [Pseudomonas sp. PDM25]|uniref:hypothetical protein n=1 Tax=Pseudomonas sp. PDM25 TaxID=2854772 RepID=UPI00210FF255